MQQSQRKRYENDPMYHRVVDTLENLIQECQLTPSEVRDAAMLACIHYEMRQAPDTQNEEVLKALSLIGRYRNREMNL